MSTSINDGGVWKSPKEVHVRDGGTWKEARAGYVNEGGTWKKVYPDRIIDLLTKAGLTSGLLVCLDASDENSYNGAGQVWTSVCSPNVTDFYLGASGSVEPSDPVFVGNAGHKNSHFELPSGGLFTETTAAWGDDAFVKNGYEYTVALLHFNAAGVLDKSQHLFCTGKSATSPYCIVGMTLDRNPRFFIDPTGAAGAVDTVGSLSVPEGALNLLAYSIKDATSQSYFQVNGNQELVDTNNPQSNTNNPSGPACIGMIHAGAITPSQAGSRFYGVIVWNRALSSSELTALHTTLKTSYPSIA